MNVKKISQPLANLASPKHKIICHIHVYQKVVNRFFLRSQENKI